MNTFVSVGGFFKSFNLSTKVENCTFSWNPKECSPTRLERWALLFLIYFLQAATPLGWLHLCWASEALSGVGYSNLLPPSMAQGGNWILGGRLLGLVHLRFNKSLGKMPDPAVNYFPSWWLLLKSLSTDGWVAAERCLKCEFTLKVLIPGLFDFVGVLTVGPRARDHMKTFYRMEQSWWGT